MKKNFEKNIENQELNEVENLDQYLDLDIRTPISKEAREISENPLVSRGLDCNPAKEEQPQRCCASHCSKLNTFSWLEEIPASPYHQRFPIVEVRFKNAHKEFFKLPQGEFYQTGDIVAVEAVQGHDIGIVSLSGDAVKSQMIKKNVPLEEVQKKVYRRARVADLEKWVELIRVESDIMLRSRYIAWDLKLNMKVNDVEYQGDGSKAIFYYSADDRIDFRELIKILADQFKIKIEMRQIGVRQEAARLGGIAHCGRELCCSTWLSNFHSVSTANARTQQLSLNPQKLAGQCGKLKCCLNYEQLAYQEELKNFPEGNAPLKTKKGDCFCVKIDIFKKIMWYSYANNSNILFAIPVDAVKKIMTSNAKKEYPDSLEMYALTNTSKTDEGSSSVEDLKKIE